MGLHARRGRRELWEVIVLYFWRSVLSGMVDGSCVFWLEMRKKGGKGGEGEGRGVFWVYTNVATTNPTLLPLYRTLPPSPWCYCIERFFLADLSRRSVLTTSRSSAALLAPKTREGSRFCSPAPTKGGCLS